MPATAPSTSPTLPGNWASTRWPAISCRPSSAPPASTAPRACISSPIRWGGLVLRAYLANGKPANLGRVVMIVPPNHGTIAADNAGKNFFLKRFFGPALPQMGTGADAWHRRLGPADFSPGIIAGRGVINPLYTKKFGGPNDGIVAVESAKLEGMRDFIVLPYSHTMILFRRETSRQVLAYLQDGRFAR